MQGFQPVLVPGVPSGAERGRFRLRRAIRRREMTLTPERIRRHFPRQTSAVTDDAELVERFGGKVEIVEGSPLNLKIATPADLKLAQALGASL